MCEYNRSWHKEVLQNEKSTQNQKGMFGISLCIQSYLCWCLFVTGLSSQSVYGLQNDIRTHSPTHTPVPEAKQPTEEELQDQVRSKSDNLGLQTGAMANFSLL